MKSVFKWAASAGLVAATAFAVFSGSAPKSGDVQAAGDDFIGFEYSVVGGTIPAAGTAVGSTVVVDQDDTPVQPTRSAFFDFTLTTNTRIGNTVGPNNPNFGGDMPASAIGARAGTIGFTIQTNVVLALAGSPCGTNCPNSGNFRNLVPECGDNPAGAVTVDWTGSAGLADDTMLTATAAPPFDIHVGNMAGSDVFVDTGFNWDGGPDEAKYAHMGGPLIQTYDDDNNDGISDATQDTVPPQSGIYAEDTVAGAGTDPADPWANDNAGRTAYQDTGQAEDQEDHDDDGLPNGIENMPDFLPVVAQAFGIETFWAARTEGIAEALATAAAPTSVHFMGFTGVPGVGNVTVTILANPNAPAAPTYVATCTPFTSTVNLQATTDVDAFTNSSSAPAGVTGGNSVSTVSNDAAGASVLVLSDGGDYDLDGLIGREDNCATDTDNADGDNDRLSGACDPTPGVVDSDAAGGAGSDYDGDGFKNNADNCPTISNPDQADDDGDGAGDNPFCDTFVTIDTLTGFVSGQGNGAVAPITGTVPATTSAIDNDRACVDTLTAGAGASESSSDGPVMGACTDVIDASDDGTPDLATELYAPAGADAGPDTDSDEDGDGCADNVDDNNYNPLITDGGCTPLGGGRATDYDLDGCSNAEELGLNVALGGKKNPLSWWDHFDVNGDQAVDLSDTLDVLGFFGAGPNDPGANERDRAIPVPAQPEDIIPSDDGVDLTDALNTLAQFGIGCSAGDASLTQVAPTDGSYIGQ